MNLGLEKSATIPLITLVRVQLQRQLSVLNSCRQVLTITVNKPTWLPSKSSNSRFSQVDWPNLDSSSRFPLSNIATFARHWDKLVLVMMLCKQKLGTASHLVSHHRRVNTTRATAPAPKAKSGSVKGLAIPLTVCPMSFGASLMSLPALLTAPLTACPMPCATLLAAFPMPRPILPMPCPTFELTDRTACPIVCAVFLNHFPIPRNNPMIDYQSYILKTGRNPLLTCPVTLPRERQAARV